MANDLLRQEHEALLDQLAATFALARRLGLIRTSRALQDAVRLSHWESASVFDNGFVPKRRTDEYDAKVTVLTVDDEISTI